MTKLKSVIEKFKEATKGDFFSWPKRKKPYIVYLPDIKEYWITDGDRFFDGIRWNIAATKGDGFLSKRSAEKWLKVAPIKF
jgi:hypothetical protein